MIWSAIASVILPLLAIILPGIALAPYLSESLVGTCARIILWSVSGLTLFSLAAITFHIPLLLVAIIAVIISIISLGKNWRQLRQPYVWWYAVSVITPFILIYAIFAGLFLHFHNGLPTGDGQKAIFWANIMRQEQRLPDYQLSWEHLNRDPVDFYTPGLHSLTALVLSLAPASDLLLPLITFGFFTIAVALSVALVAAAITEELIDRRARWLAIFLTVLLILTNIRFLRYLREPGYHWQNAVGELFVFGLLLLAISLLRRWRWLDAILACLVAGALAVTHQFSAFLTVFIVSPLLLTFIIQYRHSIFKRRIVLYLAALCAFLIITLGMMLGLHHKIPHFFTTTPHLLAQILPLVQYPTTMGTVWLLAGIAGVALFFRQFGPSQPGRQAARLGFAMSTVIILILSQGPRLGIDIPPVRTLFYGVIPLSIAGSYTFTLLFRYVRTWPKKLPRLSARLALLLLLIFPTAASAREAFRLSHTIRTNSTLTADLTYLINQLQAPSPSSSDSILVDDYDRRSSSWLLLTNHPTFSRLAADLQIQMNEAMQSPERSALYLKQLDFEKIFSLGSLPVVRPLLEKYNIGWVTGIGGTSNSSLRHNPLYQPTYRADDITLYRVQNPVRTDSLSPPLSSWLLRASTLANDIGDEEDTYEHLPASLRATRLSAPFVKDHHTYRVTTAPYIPLRFNVDDYVRVLWAKEGRNQPDIPLEFLITFVSLPPSSVHLVTASGTAYPLPKDGELLKIDPGDVPFDPDGFVTLTLVNPNEEPVAIDLVALGLARVP